jgi:hypothetical protein
VRSTSMVDQCDGVDLPERRDIDPADLIETPIHGSHLGLRSCDRDIKAVHMTASDFVRDPDFSLARRGPSTHVPAIHVGRLSTMFQAYK